MMLQDLAILEALNSPIPTKLLKNGEMPFKPTKTSDMKLLTISKHSETKL
jgi:hypothetical protein